MKKFKVTYVVETVVDVEIEAHDVEDARDKANDLGVSTIDLARGRVSDDRIVRIEDANGNLVYSQE